MLHFLVVSRYKFLSVGGNVENRKNKKKRERKEKEMKKSEFFFCEM